MQGLSRELVAFPHEASLPADNQERSGGTYGDDAVRLNPLMKRALGVVGMLAALYGAAIGYSGYRRCGELWRACLCALVGAVVAFGFSDLRRLTLLRLWTLLGGPFGWTRGEQALEGFFKSQGSLTVW
jgi:hypothetical protein